ncbi:MAG: DUF2628 domain-containing protein [Campylobacterota bacterium]|nr:DUF2628 domain-containing protein [Campylobacterota bacterium]
MQETQEKSYEDEMIEAFIDKPSKTLWYKLSFEKFNFNGVDTLKWNWSWWAFGTGFLYLLYRKQYLPSLGLFFLSMMLGFIPFIGTLLSMILAGGYSSYFVYQGYKKKRLEVENIIEDKEKRVQAMREVGGYHQWVVWVYVGLVTLVFVTVLTAALTIPPMHY